MTTSNNTIRTYTVTSGIFSVQVNAEHAGAARFYAKLEAKKEGINWNFSESVATPTLEVIENLYF